MAYVNEFETGNALGSLAREEKLVRFYASLLCLPPHLTAKLGTIMVALLCHTKYWKKFGNEKVFGSVLREINE